MWGKILGSIAGAAAGKLLGGKGGRSTQTTTTELNPLQRQGLEVMMPDAIKLYQQGGPKYYAGNTVADRSPDTMAGLDMARQFALGGATTGAADAMAANRAWLNPDMVTNLGAIPGYEGMATDISRRVNQNLMESVLPSIRSSGVLAGGYGDSKNQMAQALAAGRSQDNLAGQLSQLGLNTWTQANQFRENAIQMMPMLMQLGLLPSNIMNQVGAANEADAQKRIDADKARWDFGQQAPYVNLQFLKDMIGRAGDYGGKQTTTGTVQPAPGTGILQGLGVGGYLSSLFSGGAPSIPLLAGGATGSFGLPTGSFGLPSTSFGRQTDWSRILAPQLGA